MQDTSTHPILASSHFKGNHSLSVIIGPLRLRSFCMFNSVYFAKAGPANQTFQYDMNYMKGSIRLKSPTLISERDQKPHGHREVVRARWMDLVI